MWNAMEQEGNHQLCVITDSKDAARTYFEVQSWKSPRYEEQNN
jgi:hypothetical protein